MHNLKQQQLQYTVADWTWLRYARVSTVLFFLKKPIRLISLLSKKESWESSNTTQIRVASTQFCRCFVRSKKKKTWIHVFVDTFALCCKHKSSIKMKRRRNENWQKICVETVACVAGSHTRANLHARLINQREKRPREVDGEGCLPWKLKHGEVSSPDQRFFEQKKTFLCSFSPAPLFSVIFFSIGRRFVCLSVFFCHFSAFAIQNAVKLWFFLRGHMLSGHLSVLVYV